LGRIRASRREKARSKREKIRKSRRHRKLQSQAAKVKEEMRWQFWNTTGKNAWKAENRLGWNGVSAAADQQIFLKICLSVKESFI